MAESVCKWALHLRFLRDFTNDQSLIFSILFQKKLTLLPVNLACYLVSQPNYEIVECFSPLSY